MTVMPRQMPRLDLEFSSQATLALGIVSAGEISRVSSDHSVKKEWTLNRLEALYELAFLRVFATWEMCLEAVFLRSLCGFSSIAGGQEVRVGGLPYCPTLAAAEHAVMGAASFLLWHDPAKVAQRCRTHFVSGSPGIQETVITSNLAGLRELAAIRHRIVHVHQKDAKNKFDAATISRSGQTFPVSRPGKFLRAHDSSMPPRRWLNALIDELVGLAGQIV